MSNSGSTSKGHQHSIHGGLTSKACSEMDSSRKIHNGRSVNDGATRDSVATVSSTGKDGGKLK
jgi:hypothetical protein